MLLICEVFLSTTSIFVDFSNFLQESGLSYFRVLSICLLLVCFVSAERCHCFDYVQYVLMYKHTAYEINKRVPQKVVQFRTEVTLEIFSLENRI